MTNEKYTKELMGIIAKIKDPAFLYKFLKDLLTPREFDEIIKRWQIVKELDQKIPQRQISKNLKVSISTVTRGSRVLGDKKSAFYQILKKYDQ